MPDTPRRDELEDLTAQERFRAFYPEPIEDHPEEAVADDNERHSLHVDHYDLREKGA